MTSAMVGSANNWSGDIESTVTLLLCIVSRPWADLPRRTADGLAAHSIYFREMDGNLLELMAAD